MTDHRHWLNRTQKAPFGVHPKVCPVLMPHSHAFILKWLPVNFALQAYFERYHTQLNVEDGVGGWGI